MKTKKLSLISIGLFLASFILLEHIEFNEEYIFNLSRYIFIRVFRANKIFTNSLDFNFPLLVTILIIGYAVLNYCLNKNKIFLLCNQFFLGLYFAICIFPVLSGKYQLENSTSTILFTTNIIIILAISIINIKQIKNSKM